VEKLIRVVKKEIVQITTVDERWYIKAEKEKQFDFAFLDADKELNSEYFDLILPMIKVGGIIATDNILYPEKFRPMMEKFVNYVKKIPNVQTFTLDLGNGEQISMRTC